MRSFDLTNVPSMFYMFMNKIFHPYLNKFMVVYLDDIVVYNITLEECVKKLR